MPEILQRSTLYTYGCALVMHTDTHTHMTPTHRCGNTHAKHMCTHTHAHTHTHTHTHTYTRACLCLRTCTHAEMHDIPLWKFSVDCIITLMTTAPHIVQSVPLAYGMLVAAHTHPSHITHVTSDTTVQIMTMWVCGDGMTHFFTATSWRVVLCRHSLTEPNEPSPKCLNTSYSSMTSSTWPLERWPCVTSNFLAARSTRRLKQCSKAPDTQLRCSVSTQCKEWPLRSSQGLVLAVGKQLILLSGLCFAQKGEKTSTASLTPFSLRWWWWLSDAVTALPASCSAFRVFGTCQRRACVAHGDLSIKL